MGESPKRGTRKNPTAHFRFRNNWVAAIDGRSALAFGLSVRV
jgi:hypothetical protein